jgi:AbrB family looped-hinge helix DNA binding protein
VVFLTWKWGCRRGNHEALVKLLLSGGNYKIIDRMDKRVIEVIVSARYQVVIPKAARDRLGIEPGQKMYMIPYMKRIELIPARQMAEGQGFLAGIDTGIEREDDRF